MNETGAVFVQLRCCTKHKQRESPWDTMGAILVDTDKVPKKWLKKSCKFRLA